MKRLASVSMVMAAMVVLLSSCNCYKKMIKKADEVTVTCAPTVLSLKGSTVSADVTVNYPDGYFNKKAVLKVTPVLVFEGGEIVGTPKFLQGEKVDDNYTPISADGGSYTQTISFPFDERALLSTLELRVESKCAGKDKDFVEVTTVTVAQGISAIQADACYAAGLQLMADNFRRVTTISEEAEIKYLINSSKVRSVELTTEQLKMFEDFVKENSDKSRTTLGSVQSNGYASPDGPVKFNDKLSKKRSETAKAALSERLEGVNATYNEMPYGEDWEGFKALVEASNIEDKDLILQVLQMYSSPVQRDKEIMNMSQVFDVLKEQILPELRRTKLVATADVEGFTDSELVDAATNNLSKLNLEEMLYAATLVSDVELQAKVYKTAAQKFNDNRAYNNLGVALVKMSKLADAKDAFNKAASIQSAPEITNNLGVVALAQGNMSDAKRYLSNVSNAEAKGLMALTEGDYATAARLLKGYNLAVAQICNNDLTGAKSTLAGETCPMASYLKAVVAARQGNTSDAIANLKSAIAKDGALKAKAQKDVNFAKLFEITEFKAL